jgi:predicted PurR-regulated permease PerM
VRHLHRIQVAGRQAPRFVWVIAVYVVLITVGTIFFTSFVPILSNELAKIRGNLPEVRERLREEWVPAAAGWIQRTFAEPTPSAEAKLATTPDAPPDRIRLVPGPDGSYELDFGQLRLEAVQTDEGRTVLRAVEPEEEVAGTERLADAINRHLREFVTESQNWADEILGLGQKFLLGVLKAITTFILLLMISAFLLVDTERILRWFRNLVPARYYQDFDNVILLMDKGLSGAIRGQLIICMVNGVLTWIGLMLLDVNYHYLLALLAAVLSLIPIFGSIISSIPIVIVALVSGEGGFDLVKGVLVLAWIIGIHLLEANLLNPKIMGTAARIHPVIVVFAVVAGEQTYGPIGALLGVPLVSAVQAVFLYLRRKVKDQQEAEQSSPPTASLSEN